MTKFLHHNTEFYHGTFHDFDRFFPLSHFGTYDAAQIVLVNGPHEIGEYLNAPLQLRRLAPKDNTPNTDQTEKTIKAKFNMDKTYEISDYSTHHDILYYKDMFLYHIFDELKLQGIPLFYDTIFNAPMAIDIRDVENELMRDNLYKIETQTRDCLCPDEINRYHLCFQRMIHYWESKGYNGFHYTNIAEAPGHVSYVVFRPENILLNKKSTNTPVCGNNSNFSDRIYRTITLAEQKTLEQEREKRAKAEQKKATAAEAQRISINQEYIKTIQPCYEYWARQYFDETLPQICEVTRQPKQGYHGLDHTTQVVLFGIILAIAANTNPEHVMLAAALHDCARTNDKYDLKHAPNCKPIAERFLRDNASHLFPGIQEKIVNAIINHTTGTIAPDMISGCLWDADRIRLSWERGYQARYFTTHIGHTLANLTPEQQSEYTMQQQRFLTERNLIKQY